MKIKIGTEKLFFDSYRTAPKHFKPTNTQDFRDSDEYKRNSQPIIVLHDGLGYLNHISCVPFWSQFSDIAEVFFIDQRGCGYSDVKNMDNWCLELLSEDVFLFSESLGLEKPIIAGIGDGGYVAIKYATNHPDHANSLILCNTEAKPDIEETIQAYESLGDEKAATSARQFHLKINQNNIEGFISNCLPLITGQLSDAAIHINLKLLSHMRNMNFYNFNLLPSLSKIKCPVLAVTEDGNPAHPLKLFNEMTAALDKNLAKIEIVTGKDNPFYHTKNDALKKTIQQFIINNIT